MPTNRKVIDFKIHNLTEEQFQELKEAGQIDPNAIYCTPDETAIKFEELSEQINTKQDKATAVNYDNITNCITEIPQDIKLELNNGTLTLKAGSKLTNPTDGTQRTTTEDKNGTLATNGQYMVFADKSSGGLQLSNNYTVAAAGSGSSLPADGSTYNVFYNATNNTIYRWNGSSWVSWGVAFPLGIITVSGGVISSIDQVFNGFGYIGSTVFALPGVKGLIPDGRNPDGSLKSIETELTNVQIISGGGSDQKNIYAIVHSGGALGLNGRFKYDEKNNATYDNVNIAPQFLLANFDNSGGKITNFTPKTAFHAVDYNDLTDTSKNTITIAAPAGMVAAFAGTTPPSGWLKCDGSAVSRTTYAKLFAAIGGNYGWGDGSTTFNLPTQSVLPLGTSAKVTVYGTSKSIQVTDGTSNASLAAGMALGTGNRVGVGTKIENLNKGDQGSGFASLKNDATIGLKTSTAYGDSGIVGTADIANATGAKAIVCIKY